MFKKLKDKLKAVDWKLAGKRFLGLPLLALIGYDIHAMVVDPSFSHFMGLSIDVVLVAWWVEFVYSHNGIIWEKCFDRHIATRILFVGMFLFALPALLILGFGTWLITKFIPDAWRETKDVCKEMFQYIKTGR